MRGYTGGCKVSCIRWLRFEHPSKVVVSSATRTASYQKPDPHAVACRLGGCGYAFLHSASSRVAYQRRVATSKNGLEARIPRRGSCAAGTSASPDNLDSRKQTRASGMLKTSEASFQLKQCGRKGTSLPFPKSYRIRRSCPGTHLRRRQATTDGKPCQVGRCVCSFRFQSSRYQARANSILQHL